jgi:signal transduction histidine kinase
MPARLLDSTLFRVSIVLGTAFLAAMLLAGLVAWRLVDAELAGRVDESIREEFAVIRQAYGDTDLTDLRDSVTSRADATVGHNRVYLLRATDGAVLAGNITRAVVPLGWSLVDGSALGVKGDDRYRVFSSAVDGNPLLVGASLRQTEAVGRIFVASLTIAGGLLFATVVGLGVLFAIRGQRRLAEISGVMRRVGMGELAARIPVSQRRDDIDRVALQVNDALDRLSALVESMRQVSVDIAHDLKTPLNRLTITVFDAVATAEGTGVEPLLVQVEQEIEQINATFDALLRIAQIESGSRKAKFALVSLGSILTQLSELYADVAEERGQSLVVDISSGLGPVQGDKELLVQMFANLIENAIRHAGPGASLEINARKHGERVIVEVADDGPGIPEAEREAVFQRLYRVERSRTTPGTGLGLSLVKAVADLHGAIVTLADNSPGLRVLVEIRTAAA